ncbi:hypothetical protein [Asticcacaulis excentricus]|uniref:hypothetical protein n=1 Tax=Asticcacaulis excentricus TaxID=78587 RepID=UPI000F83A2CD|nr:hypothetical protein [Asticcacaulis excentricus]
MDESPTISFGDNVRIASTPETIKLGVAGKNGQVYGITTPSVTGIEMIGQSPKDNAVNVYFEDASEALWFAPELVEFVDHGAGTAVEIAGQKSVRNTDGSWSNSTAQNTFLSRFLGLFR